MCLQVSWEKDGVELQTAFAPGLLVIESVSMEDAGAYVCVAKNVAGKRMSQRGVLEVVGKISTFYFEKTC